MIRRMRKRMRRRKEDDEKVCQSIERWKEKVKEEWLVVKEVGCEGEDTGGELMNTRQELHKHL